MSSMFQYINEIEQLSKINVEKTIQHAKTQLIETIQNAGNQLVKQFEDDIRNKVIDQIGLQCDDLELYGKMVDLPKYLDMVDDILSWLIYSNIGYIISKELICDGDHRLINNYASLFENQDETNHIHPHYYSNNNNYCRTIRRDRRYVPNSRFPSLCKYRHIATSNDSKLMFGKTQFRTMIDKVILKNNDEYIINFITIVHLNKKTYSRNIYGSQQYSVDGNYFTGKINCIIVTNLANFYIFENDLDKCGKCGCEKGSDCKNKQLAIKKSDCYPDIVTNTKMNNIFIDICKTFKPLIFQHVNANLLTDGQFYVYSDVELKQIDDHTFNHIDIIYSQCRVISEKIKTYWGSNGLGTHSLHFEETFNDLNKAKSQIQTLENESEIKTKEIAKLKQENEELKKQLENVEIFKRCVEMMQIQQIPIKNTDQMQIGNPLIT